MIHAKKITAIICTLLSLCCLFTSCSAGEPDIIGQWYMKGNYCLDVREDGSYNFERDYGTGTWKYLKDGQIEFIDFYGYNQIITIKSDDIGEYIVYNNATFYRDSYPDDEKIADNNNNAVENAIATDSTVLDPFEGLTYELSGISPYCKITVNNIGCSEQVKKYVTYTPDKEYYAIGETAVITAKLYANTGDEKFTLSKSESTYKIEGCPEYVTKAEQLDMDYLKGEVEDKVTSLISESVGTIWLCKKSLNKILDLGTVKFNISSVIPTHKSTYLYSLKQEKNTKKNNDTPYNTCAFIYSMEVICDNGKTGVLTVNISANNVVRYPDGTINWDDGNYTFDVSGHTEGIENCITTTIMNNSENYNISKIYPVE